MSCLKLGKDAAELKIEEIEESDIQNFRAEYLALRMTWWYQKFMKQLAFCINIIM